MNISKVPEQRHVRADDTLPGQVYRLASCTYASGFIGNYYIKSVETMIDLSDGSRRSVSSSDFYEHCPDAILCPQGL